MGYCSKTQGLFYRKKGTLFKKKIQGCCVRGPEAWNPGLLLRGPEAWKPRLLHERPWGVAGRQEAGSRQTGSPCSSGTCRARPGRSSWWQWRWSWWGCWARSWGAAGPLRACPQRRVCRLVRLWCLLSAAWRGRHWSLKHGKLSSGGNETRQSFWIVQQSKSCTQIQPSEDVKYCSQSCRNMKNPWTFLNQMSMPNPTLIEPNQSFSEWNLDFFVLKFPKWF